MVATGSASVVTTTVVVEWQWQGTRTTSRSRVAFVAFKAGILLGNCDSGARRLSRVPRIVTISRFDGIVVVVVIVDAITTTGPAAIVVVAVVVHEIPIFFTSYRGGPREARNDTG